MIPRVLPYLWYPLVLGGAVFMFAAMTAADLPVIATTYVPIILAALVIVLLELAFPARREWRPTLADIKADAAFMVFVQIVVPRALLAAIILVLSGWTHAHLAHQWWPHAWPLAAQIVAIVLIVDFTRYWLHRACHRFNMLWRLHAVHHSPDVLYTLNVGRFHPFEKALHFSLDTVPFLLLGVDPRALAGYFLLYSVNGIFQHSNVRLRYGWLNYLVGSAETHRWHHARNPKTANCNFGNTTIVWDLVFGTWYLPKNREVDDIGIPDKTYPKGFWQQMWAPFRNLSGVPGLAELAKRAADVLMTLHLRLERVRAGWRIRKAANDPMRIQRALLAQILSANRSTSFGRQYGFEVIPDYETFAKRVPVSEYEALRPFVDAEIEKGEQALTAEPPIRYTRTSGTTGRAKDIPLVATHLAALRRIHRAAVAIQHRICPAAFDGGILALVSPADEGILPNGKPYGSASGVVAGNTPAIVRGKFVVPSPVLAVSDSRLKYLLILRLALARPDITYIGAANATTLLTMMQLYREHASALIEDVGKGGFFLAHELPAEVRSALRGHLRASPQRSAQLMRIRKNQPDMRICDLWPSLRLVVTWTCASAALAADALRRELSAETRVLELGYISSEFRGTITIGRNAGSGLPTLDTHFYEFVEREKWDSGEPEFLTLDRIRKGVDYYIIVTTPSGLYRYFINDLVRVKGFLRNVPLLKFVQKGKGVTNITGEKLYEAQVLAAVRNVAAETGCALRFMMLLADEESRCYRLYVEPDGERRLDAQDIARRVDVQLQALNIEYMAKRESGRLGELSAAWLEPGTYEIYKRYCVERGQREGQFKTVALAYRRSFDFNLDMHTERQGHASPVAAAVLAPDSL